MRGLDVQKVVGEAARLKLQSDVVVAEGGGAPPGGGAPAPAIDPSGAFVPTSEGASNEVGQIYTFLTGAVTDPDAKDGHTHVLVSVDGATGIGVTEISGGSGGVPAHAHAVVAGVVQMYFGIGYASDHGGAFQNP